MFNTPIFASHDRNLRPLIKPDVITEPTWDCEVLQSGFTIFSWREKKLTVSLNNCDTNPLKVLILNTSSSDMYYGILIENKSYSVLFENLDTSCVGDKYTLYPHQVDLSEFAERGTIFKVLRKDGENSAVILFYDIFETFPKMTVARGRLTKEGLRQLNH